MRFPQVRPKGQRLHLLLLLLAFPALLRLPACHADGHVRVLTDKTFEHDTQATTGSTTGDWFIMFSAPWCGHCKAMGPVWEQLATLLAGRVNVGKVDATQETALSRRFDVQAFPSIILISKGKMFEYSGGRTLEDLKNFALGDFKDQEGIPIPEEQRLVQRVQEWLADALDQTFGIINHAFPALLLILAIGFLLGLVTMWIICSCCCGRSAATVEAASKKSFTPVPLKKKD
eukprot:GHVT01032385.1.p2 GENE.GHVT01032385.1~~GHVT01032385.1.p2  ORF type:complete len:231 (-),score=53.03 GHVT01032385.1:628-1320(-)